MYLYTVGLWLLLTWSKVAFCQFGLTEDIIRMYKKTTLRLREDDYQNRLPIHNKYDYVVVGAGPSGCAIANRLSEDPDKTVLLLEAGPETNMIHTVPIMHLLIFNTEYNWKFSSQYNPEVCRSMDERTCPWPSGKGLGGGTVINAMLYTRGNKRDYDRWAEEGNKGWSYDDLLEYFKKLENTRISALRESPYRGKDGPVSVSYSPYPSNASLVFIDAGRELGYPVLDYNEPYRSGFAKMQLTMENGGRWSAASAYLKPADKRSNLHIVQRAMVSKVLIDPVTKTAFGVEFFKKGKKREVRVKREVILAAGAFGSPKLLMLSGVGHKEHLESLNIPVIRDLPVGDNLQEHVGATLLPFITKSSSTFLPNYGALFSQLPIELLKYMQTHSGPPSSSGCDSLAYVSSRYADENNPDIELLFVGATYASDFGNLIRKTVGVRDDVYESFYKPLENETSMSIWVMGCYPKSRGTVRLFSKDPLHNPVIENNFLNRTEDLDVIVDGIKIAIELSKTKAMRAHGVRLYNKHQPGCENFNFGTDEYWECTVRQITAQYHHQCGTCKMGPDGDPTTVVDPRLRVHGIRNLRVADASIMPTIPAGHTMAPAYMIGEKAADLIKQDND